MQAAPEVRDNLGQDLEIGLIQTIAPFVRRKFFIDVGAEKGSFAAAMFSLGMRGTLFEPMTRHYKTLEKLSAAHESHVFPYAIDEQDGVRDFFIASDSQGIELDFFHSLQKLEGDLKFRHSRKIEVTCRSLESLTAQGILPKDVGILKTDTEGNDIRVLRGLGGTRPELIVCEYFTDGLYAGWQAARPELAIALMRSMGYSRFVATKRIGAFEYITSSPTGFLSQQWGNLFFMGDCLCKDAEAAIVKFLSEVEARFLENMQAIATDRVAKEAVIQGLLARS